MSDLIYIRTGLFWASLLSVFSSSAHDAISQVETEAGAVISVSHIQSAADLPSQPPAPGTYRVHMLDVGTGLSILVQGADFSLLFDAGSQDDWAGISNGKNKSRAAAYLHASIGASNTPGDCPKPYGDSLEGVSSAPALDHLFLSHVHKDHGNMLDEVLRCYSVKNVWDTGVHLDQAFYKNFVKKVSQETEAIYHTAVTPSANKKFTVRNTTFDLSGITAWVEYSEGESVALGSGASFTILHKDTTKHSDPNTNSMVVRVDLGKVSLLLTGDAESGERLSPSADVGDIEAELIEQHNALIDVDILQVGHHGSLTSSRSKFVKQVSPLIALVSSGPKKYGSIVLPDDEVLVELKAQGALVLRTDKRDSNDEDNQSGCGDAERIGKEEKQPGGCDSYLLEIKG